jgi:hypothetical protein
MTWLFSKALMQDYENSRCSPELAEESSEVTCLDGVPYAQLNVMPTPHKFWRNDKTIESCGHSQFGLTSQVLTEDRGAELLTSFLADFPARTSALAGRAPGSRASEADCGWRWPASFAKFNLDTHTWKTRQCSLLEDSEPFLPTWPQWGSMRDGECLAHTTPALPTKEKEYGFWPTPTAMTNTGGAALCKWGGSRARQKLRTMVTTKELNGPLNPEFPSWLMGWPIGWTSLTPLAMDKFREWQQHGGSSANET